MKTTVINTTSMNITTKEKNINWSHPCVLVSKHDSQKFALTTGKHSEEWFDGLVITPETVSFSAVNMKDEYELFNGELTFTNTNINNK